MPSVHTEHFSINKLVFSVSFVVDGAVFASTGASNNNRWGRRTHHLIWEFFRSFLVDFFQYWQVLCAQKSTKWRTWFGLSPLEEELYIRHAFSSCATQSVFFTCCLKEYETFWTLQISMGKQFFFLIFTIRKILLNNLYICAGLQMCPKKYSSLFWELHW